jgi:hypothetical protein
MSRVGMCLSNEINQTKKKPHLISNIFQIAKVVDILPAGIKKTQFRQSLEGMTESQLIELNCKLFNSLDL